MSVFEQFKNSKQLWVITALSLVLVICLGVLGYVTLSEKTSTVPEGEESSSSQESKSSKSESSSSSKESSSESSSESTLPAPSAPPPESYPSTPPAPPVSSGWTGGTGGFVSTPNNPTSSTLTGKVLSVTVSGSNDEAGVYTDATISSGGVALRNKTINSDLRITSRAGNGEILLQNVIVKGKIIVEGGDSLHLHDVTAAEVVFQKASGASTLEVSGSSTIATLTIKNHLTLNENELKTGFAGVRNAYTRAGAPVWQNFTLASGELDSLTTHDLTNVEVKSGTKIDKLTAAAKTFIKLKGTVSNLIVAHDEVTYDRRPSSVDVKSGFESPTEDQFAIGESRPETGGGSGSGSVSTPAVTVTVPDADDKVFFNINHTQSGIKEYWVSYKINSEAQATATVAYNANPKRFPTAGLDLTGKSGTVVVKVQPVNNSGGKVGNEITTSFTIKQRPAPIIAAPAKDLTNNQTKVRLSFTARSTDAFDNNIGNYDISAMFNGNNLPLTTGRIANYAYIATETITPGDTSQNLVFNVTAKSAVQNNNVIYLASPKQTMTTAVSRPTIATKQAAVVTTATTNELQITLDAADVNGKTPTVYSSRNGTIGAAITATSTSPDYVYKFVFPNSTDPNRGFKVTLTPTTADTASNLYYPNSAIITSNGVTPTLVPFNLSINAVIPNVKMGRTLADPSASPASKNLSFGFEGKAGVTYKATWRLNNGNENELAITANGTQFSAIAAPPTGVHAGDIYTFTVVAKGVGGAADATATTSKTVTALPAPTNPSINVAGSAAVGSFTKTADATGYDLVLTNDSTPKSYYIAGTDESSFTAAENLTNNMTISFSVTAKGDGALVADSTAATAMVKVSKLAPPTDLTATPDPKNPQQLTLSFTKGSDAQHAITINGTAKGITSVSSVTHKLSGGVTEEVTFTARAVGSRSGENIYLDSDTATSTKFVYTFTQLAAPQNLRLTHKQNTDNTYEYEFKWDAVTNAKGYSAKYETTDGTMGDFVVNGATGTVGKLVTEITKVTVSATGGASDNNFYQDSPVATAQFARLAMPTFATEPVTVLLAPTNQLKLMFTVPAKAKTYSVKYNNTPITLDATNSSRTANAVTITIPLVTGINAATDVTSIEVTLDGYNDGGVNYLGSSKKWVRPTPVQPITTPETVPEVNK